MLLGISHTLGECSYLPTISVDPPKDNFQFLVVFDFLLLHLRLYHDHNFTDHLVFLLDFTMP
jgi:hypothetical protein